MKDKVLKEIMERLGSGYTMVMGKDRESISEFLLEVYPPLSKCNDVLILQDNHAIAILVKKTDYLIGWIKKIYSMNGIYEKDDIDKIEETINKFNVLDFRPEGVCIGKTNELSELAIHK